MRQRGTFLQRDAAPSPTDAPASRRDPDWSGLAFELKYDGFRGIVSTERDLEVRSRRGWNMTARVPELAELPPGLVLEGELVALNEQGAPHWPLVVERVLHGNTAIPLTFVAFDVLRVDGHDVTGERWSQRRTLLEGVWVDCGCGRLADVFDDGHALFDAVVSYGLEGIVAKRRNGIYRPGYRGWVKAKTQPTGGARARSRTCSVVSGERVSRPRNDASVRRHAVGVTPWIAAG